MDKYTVRGSNGSVDVTASAAAYAAALTEWVKSNEIPTDRISNAVSAVLDSFPGQRLPMPQLLSLACQKLGSTPDQFSAVSEHVRAYVRGQAEAGSLVIVKGKGGGVGRPAESK